MNYKKGDIVQVLQKANSVWCGVDMVVTRPAVVDMRQSAVIVKHPTMGEGGFDSYTLFLVKARKSFVEKSFEYLAGLFSFGEKPKFTEVEESFTDRLRREAIENNKPKKGKKKAKKKAKKKVK